jgi:hypothetical protein
VGSESGARGAGVGAAALRGGGPERWRKFGWLRCGTR